MHNMKVESRLEEVPVNKICMSTARILLLVTGEFSPRKKMTVWIWWQKLSEDSIMRLTPKESEIVLVGRKTGYCLRFVIYFFNSLLTHKSFRHFKITINQEINVLFTLFFQVQDKLVSGRSQIFKEAPSDSSGSSFLLCQLPLLVYLLAWSQYFFTGTSSFNLCNFTSTNTCLAST